MSSSSEPLIDPELLKGLSEEQKQEALAAAAAAKRAEERAEQRALERALKRKEEERRREKELQSARNEKASDIGRAKTKAALAGAGVVFIPKRKREQMQQEQTEEQSATAKDLPLKKPVEPAPKKAAVPERYTNNRGRNSYSSATHWNQREVEEVKRAYLGKTVEEAEQERAERRKKMKLNKKQTFRFNWEASDDTFKEHDPLYSSLATSMSNRRQRNAKPKRDALSQMSSVTIDSVVNKPLERMTQRDWKIIMENYEIVVKGGRAPPPMRSFREMPTKDLPQLHPSILDSIENVMGFKEPSPIQRQAIPIGLQRRDLIGIAETGSGKTVAFGVPICNYLLNLPSEVLNRVAEDGPLALVMAPTRELAIQINEELSKLLSRQKHIKNVCIIGGQQLQFQANELRKGVHILVGTPGRINECIEKSYLVLNQCACAVLDEGDRMIDMGFAPQIESVLDAMGTALKSDIEEEVYEQEKEDRLTIGVPKYRVTALFSATMPLEVERMAKKYLRHPAVISIGDKDSGKNARIIQRVMFLSSPGQKEKALRDLLSRSSHNRDDKTIVFVNEKKHADGVGRIVARMGRAHVVLHGGKNQDEREENLEKFRRGGVVLGMFLSSFAVLLVRFFFANLIPLSPYLVATDVAGRGIDIPNVTHVSRFRKM